MTRSRCVSTVLAVAAASSSCNIFASGLGSFDGRLASHSPRGMALSRIRALPSRAASPGAYCVSHTAPPDHDKEPEHIIAIAGMALGGILRVFQERCHSSLAYHVFIRGREAPLQVFQQGVEYLPCHVVGCHRVRCKKPLVQREQAGPRSDGVRHQIFETVRNRIARPRTDRVGGLSVEPFSGCWGGGAPARVRASSGRRIRTARWGIDGGRYRSLGDAGLLRRIRSAGQSRRAQSASRVFLPSRCCRR